MENAAKYTRRLLNKGARAYKGLGQNFLIDDGVVQDIVNSIPLTAETRLLEVGPGLGVLTRILALNVNRMWAVELDPAKVELLKAELGELPVEWIHQDALSLNLAQLWGEEKGYMVGNLPYYITSPLIMHFLSQGANLHGMTVMVQREVAHRLTAAPGGKEYGVLSVAVQVAAEVETLFEVPPAAFWPAPKVYSAVVRLTLRPYPGLTVQPEKLISLAKAAFSQRRKTLANSLSAGLGEKKEVVTEKLRQAGIDENRRAETLSIEEFQDLTRLFG